MCAKIMEELDHFDPSTDGWMDVKPICVLRWQQVNAATSNAGESSIHDKHWADLAY